MDNRSSYELAGCKKISIHPKFRRRKMAAGGNKNYHDKKRVPSSPEQKIPDKNMAMTLITLCICVSAINSQEAFNDYGVSLTINPNVPTINERVTFICTCRRDNATISWLINGGQVEGLRTSISGDTGYLVIPAQEFNGSVVQCIVQDSGGRFPSRNVTLLAQGLLAAVVSPSVDLVGTDIFLTWTAPFTLDIPNVVPDITYCVDVVNSTSSSRILSECGITVTGFNFSIPLGRVCDNYTFTVTPVNVVGSGTIVTLGYSITVPRARNGRLLLPVSTYQLTMSAPVCDAKLTVISNDTGNILHLQGGKLIISGNIIMFTSEKLKKNQLYTVSVNASNINGSAVSYVSLSTHDVPKATFDVTSHTITTEYFEYSTAMGALYIFIFINEDRSIDFKKSIYLPLDRSSSHNYTLTDISPGRYEMFVYDIESEVTLHDSVNYPANTNMFSIISNDPQASYSQFTSSELQDCSVNYVDDVISAMCSYSGGSSVTGFQIIVQLNNADEVHKLYINVTTEHLSPGPVTVRVEESGTYHVAIFPLLGENGIVNTTIAYSQVLPITVRTSEQSSRTRIIIGIVMAITGVTAIGVVMVLMLLIIKKKTQNNVRRGLNTTTEDFNLRPPDSGTPTKEVA